MHSGKYLLLAAVVLLGRVQAQAADVDYLAHYRVSAEAGASSQAAAAMTLQDLTGKGHNLTAHGQPGTVAAAPAGANGAAAFSLRLGEPEDGFSNEQLAVQEDAPIGIEAWVRADKDTDVKWGLIASYGDARRGICLAQRGNVWLYGERDVDAWEIGPVQPGQWTHLAAVKDRQGFRLFLNGRAISSAIGYFGKADFPNGFTIGSPAGKRAAFQGQIYETRLLTFGPGKFDPEKHLLLNYEGIRSGLAWTRQQRDRVLGNLAATPGLRVVNSLKLNAAKTDWLIAPVGQEVEVLACIDENKRSASIVLANGLISRTFCLTENLACTGYKQLGTDAEFLRAVKPEARLKVDGRWLDIGGLKGQPEASYLVAEWLPQMFAGADTFRFDGLTVSQPVERYPWQPRFHAASVPWPPKGLHVAMRYVAPPSLPNPYQDLRITVHYEMYQGIPVLTKWVTLENRSGRAVTVDQVESEVLAVQQDQVDRLHLESDYSFAEVNGKPEEVMPYDKPNKTILKYQGGTTTKWSADPDYFSCAPQTAAGGLVRSLPGHYCLVTSRVPLGPAQSIKPDGSFQSMITFELLQDSDDRERQSLAHRRLYRLLAPQTSQQFIAVHARTNERKDILHLLDQMAEVGFDRMQVGPHGARPPINSDDAQVRAEWKEMADYAHARGIRFGFYELMVSSRGRGAAVNVVNPDTGQPGSPRWGQSVCVASDWCDSYFPRLFRFLDEVGVDFIGVDGVYHGDVCASTTHKYHRGLEDSQWAQWERMTTYLRECLRQGRETTTPDWYFLSGSQSTGMGYREPADKLPRELRLLLFRQYLYDGTWDKTPTMGWIGVPIHAQRTKDPRAGLEPLCENLDWYERYLAQSFASGAGLRFSAMELYDTPQTKAMVKKWVDWSRKYREILTSDIIHVRRPDGRDVDCLLHVNSQTPIKALAMVFNPTAQTIHKEQRLPLYYTGLKRTARVRIEEGREKTYTLDSESCASIPVNVPPGGVTWLTVR